MKRSASVAFVLLGATLVAACSDDAPPTEPDLPVLPDQSITTVPELGGLFFFGPPVGAVEDRAAPFDRAQLSVLVFEVCLKSALADPLSDACASPLGRWDSDGGPGGRTIFVEGDDWYQVDVSFAAFDGAELELGDTYVGRVLVGDPSGTPGVDFQVYGAFDFQLVGNRGRGAPPSGAGPAGGDSDDEPRQIVSRQTVPVKWFLGEGATAELLCETGECTTTVIEAEEGGELCFPEGDCDDPEVRAGTRIDEDVLPQDVVVTIEELDLTEEPNPLGIPNPQIGRAVRITATPSFEDLASFDTNGNGVSDIIVQGCFEVAAGQDPDDYTIFRGTPQGAERLPINPLQTVFDSDNCPTLPGGSALGDGFLGRAHVALRERVVRPVARMIGPRPLRAGDKSFTADARGFSPFVPVLELDLLPDEEPAPVVAPGETVTISACVETEPHDASDPIPEPIVPVTFEVEPGNGSLAAGDDAGSSVVVESTLEEPSGQCVNQSVDGGDVAVARASWTVPDDPGSYAARAFLDGDYVESVATNGSFELQDVVIEVLFGTEVGAAADLAVGTWPEDEIPGTLAVGEVVPPFGGSGQFTIENQGTGAAGPFSFEFRLWNAPPDQATQSFQLDLGTISGGLEASSTLTLGPDPTLPSAVPPGDGYFLGIVVDSNDDVAESDETNNVVFTGPITVVPGFSLLTIAVDGLTAIDQAGNDFVLTTEAETSGVEVVGNRIFVRWQGAIRELDAGGSVVSTIQISGAVPAWNNFVALPGGGFALLDNANDEIHFVDGSGGLVQTVPLPEDSPGELQNVHGVVVDGRLIVSQTGGQKLVEVDLSTRTASIFRDFSAQGWGSLGPIEHADGLFFLGLPSSVQTFTEAGAPGELVSFAPENNVVGVEPVGPELYTVLNFAGNVYRTEVSTGDTRLLISGLDLTDPGPEDLEFIPVTLTPP